MDCLYLCLSESHMIPDPDLIQTQCRIRLVFPIVSIWILAAQAYLGLCRCCIIKTCAWVCYSRVGERVNRLSLPIVIDLQKEFDNVTLKHIFGRNDFRIKIPAYIGQTFFASRAK